ncbi:MAG: hypothetical protein JWN98_1998 [Abditibacteriota bacterium]|nr:hypothetical protein [Abditibacteriota bacterium]
MLPVNSDVNSDVNSGLFKMGPFFATARARHHIFHGSKIMPFHTRFLKQQSTLVGALALSAMATLPAQAQVNANGAANQAGQTAGQVAGQAGQTAGQAVNQAGQTVGGVANQLPGTLNAAGQTVGQVGNTAGNLVGGLQPTLQPVTQGVGSALNNLTQPDTVSALLEFLAGVIPNHIEAHVNLDALRVEKLTVDVRGVDLRNLRVDLLVANSRNAGQVRPVMGPNANNQSGSGTTFGNSAGGTGTGFGNNANNTNRQGTNGSTLPLPGDTPIAGSSSRTR